MLVDAFERHAATTEHAHEQVVEVVRDAACQPADGFHLLRPQQHLLGPLRLRDVEPDGEHADDFVQRRGFTFTVLAPGDGDVIGCVYLYPCTSEDWDVTVQSWVRADRSELDVPLADAVASWLASDWPWERVDRCGR